MRKPGGCSKNKWCCWCSPNSRYEPVWTEEGVSDLSPQEWWSPVAQKSSSTGLEECPTQAECRNFSHSARKTCPRGIGHHDSSLRQSSGMEPSRRKPHFFCTLLHEAVVKRGMLTLLNSRPRRGFSHSPAHRLSFAKSNKISQKTTCHYLYSC